MKFGFLSSGALHLLVILIAWFGLPHIKRDPPKLDALIFVKLSDVSKVTNIPPEANLQPSEQKKDDSPKQLENLKYREITLLLFLKRSHANSQSRQK